MIGISDALDSCTADLYFESQNSINTVSLFPRRRQPSQHSLGRSWSLPTEHQSPPALIKHANPILRPCRAGLGAVEQAVAERAAKSHIQLQGLFTALQSLQRLVLQRASVPGGDMLEAQRLFAELVHGLGSLSR